MSWSEERVSALRNLWLEGYSASQVARLLGGVSRNAVIGKVHRIGLAGRASPSQPRTVGDSAPPIRARPVSVRPVVKREAVPAPRPVEATPSATVLTLGAHACRWPIGDPDNANFGFCGRVRSGLGSYCQEHRQIAFQPARPARKQDLDGLSRIAGAR